MFIITEKTRADKILDRARSISNSSDVDINFLINSYKNKFNMIWNPIDYTTQEILDVFGTKAKDLFTVSYLTTQYIKSIKPDYVIPQPTKDFTINEDGSVTII